MKFKNSTVSEIDMATSSKQFFISFILLAMLFSFGAYFMNVQGDATLGITLRTNPDLEDGLVLHYTFDSETVDLSSSTAEIRDLSSEQENGDWAAHASTTAPGVIGQALYFDGVDDRVDIADGYTTHFQEDFSIAFWMYDETISSSCCTAIASTDDFNFEDQVTVGVWYNDSPPGFRFIVGTSPTNEVYYSLRESQFFKEWNHFVAVREDTSLTLYINGEAAEGNTSGPSGTFNLANDDFLRLGPRTTGDFEGKIDDFRIYNRALGTSTISRLYELGATTKVGKTITTNPDLEEDLAFHYTFDEGSVDRSANTAEILDDSGNGVTADWEEHATTTAPGVIGQALSFDGDNDYLNTASFTYDTDITYALWVKPRTLDAEMYLLAGPDVGTPGLNIQSNGQIRFTRININDVIRTATGVITSGEWQHIAVRNPSSDGDEAQIFVNGEHSPAASQFGTAMGGNTRQTYIGQYLDGTAQFDGEIDDVRFYNTALSTSTIKRLYELGATTKVAKTVTANPDIENGLVLHYTFDGAYFDRSSSTGEIRDRSPEQEDGDWLNHSTTTVPGKIGQAIEINGGLEDIVVADGYTTHFAEDFSIATWFYVRNIPSGDSGLWTTYGGSSGDRMYGDLDQGQYVKVSLDGGDNGFNTNQNDAIPVGYQIPEFWDTWHHTVFVRDNSGDAYIYIDGVLRAATSTFHPGTYTLTGNDLLQVADGRNARHDGYLDDFRIYNRTLSAEEVLRLYELGN